MKKPLLLFLIGSLGGILFYSLHLPLPWTLGPLLTVLVWKLWRKEKLLWPKKLRDGGMIILGYALGSPFTIEVGHKILGQLPGMVGATFVTLAVSLLFGWLTCHKTGVGLINGLLGSVPGGLAQMVAICEEVEGADVAVVTLMQTLRLLTSVFTVPFIAIYGLADQAHQASLALPDFVHYQPDSVLLFASAILASIYIASKLHMPTPYLLGPMLTTIALILGGFEAPYLPRPLLALAQITIGIRIGADVELAGLANWRKISFFTFLSVLAVITTSAFVDYGISQIYLVPFLTAFIGTAPGGMAEMGITALSVDADISIVIAYQLFRLLSILLLLIPGLKWWLSRQSNRQTQTEFT
ncbi:MAG: AbrB family transcriptional regulator [Sporomusaceae bacterium]|nr:AbrB family transcriptional regulator [Sporomusaceae bacterium]